MTDLRSKNKGLASCSKRLKRVTGYLACREWLVVSPKSRWGVGWQFKGRGWLHHTPLHKGNLPSSFDWKIRLQMFTLKALEKLR